VNNTINITIGELDISIRHPASTVAHVSDHGEVRVLGNGERITQAQMLEELKTLGDGWRIESPHELFAHVSYDHKNANGAYSRDETIKDGWYWTNKPHPEFEGGRVVVGFYFGVVVSVGYFRAFARAVRVSGQ